MTPAISATLTACHPVSGDWSGPDGYVGAIVGADNVSALERTRGREGVTALGRAAA